LLINSMVLYVLPKPKDCTITVNTSVLSIKPLNFSEPGPCAFKTASSAV
jgi:hypothetical protein